MYDIYKAAHEYTSDKKWITIPITIKTKLPANQGWQKANIKKIPEAREKIFNIWYNRLNLNIGILCGKRNNITVIDIDDDLFFDELMEGVEKFTTLTSWRKNEHKRHLFFNYDTSFDKNMPNSTTHKIEVLNTGRFVVAPPSLHPEGENYEWKIDAPIIDMPDKFKDNLKKLFTKDKTFKQSVGKCRPWIKSVFSKKNVNIVDWHGAEGRTKTLFVMSELKANGASKETMLYALKLMFREDFDEYNCDSELKNIDSKRTGKSKNIKDTFSEINFSANAFGHSQGIEHSPEDWINLERKIPIMDFPGFINDYINYAKWRTDSPVEYHYTAALNILSILAGRNMMISTRQQDIYPNLYITMLGASTISRKSVSINIMEDILDKIWVSDGSLPNSFSPEAFIELLSNDERRYLINDEAGSFLLNMKKNYMADLKEMLNLFYDGKGYNRQLRTGKNKQSEFDVEEPYLNILFATTAHNFIQGSELIDVRSGWLARFIFCHPQYQRDLRRIDFDVKGKKDKIEDIATKALLIKNWIKNINQPMKVATNAIDIYGDWCEKIEKQLMTCDDEVANAVTGRMQISCLKIALLHAISRMSPYITVADMDSAIYVCDEFFYPCGTAIIREIEDEARNDLVAKVIDKLIGTLKRRGGVATRTDLLNVSKVRLKDFEDIMDVLIEGKRVRRHDGSDKGKNTSIKYTLLKEED